MNHFKEAKIHVEATVRNYFHSLKTELEISQPINGRYSIEYLAKNDEFVLILLSILLYDIDADIDEVVVEVGLRNINNRLQIHGDISLGNGEILLEMTEPLEVNKNTIQTDVKSFLKAFEVDAKNTVIQGINRLCVK